MIDFHTHVLPNIDDGSRSMDMSLAMLAEEYAQGVTEVVATPHFYAQDMSMEDFLERRDSALAKVKKKTTNFYFLFIITITNKSNNILNFHLLLL